MTTQTEQSHVSIDDRRVRGKEAAKRDAGVITRRVGAGGRPARSGRLLVAQNATREPDLVPVRHGRMMVSPFTFYRGAAKIMAADLAGTPTAGLDGPAVRGRASVQLRWLRLTGAAAAVRSERLRRDTAGSVRVRPEADGRQLHHRRPQQQVRNDRHPRR